MRNLQRIQRRSLHLITKLSVRKYMSDIEMGHILVVLSHITQVPNLAVKMASLLTRTDFLTCSLIFTTSSIIKNISMMPFCVLALGFYKINKNQKVIAELLCILEIFPQKMCILKITKAKTQI
jgi:hypothetical protein